MCVKFFLPLHEYNNHLLGPTLPARFSPTARVRPVIDSACPFRNVMFYRCGFLWLWREMAAVIGQRSRGFPPGRAPPSRLSYKFPPCVCVCVSRAGPESWRSGFRGRRTVDGGRTDGLPESRPDARLVNISQRWDTRGEQTYVQGRCICAKETIYSLWIDNLAVSKQLSLP